jgi:hypothetical protein
MWDAFRLEEAWREVDSSRRCTRDAQTPINALVKPQVINLGQSRPVAGHPMHAHSSTQVSGTCVWSVPSVSIGGKQSQRPNRHNAVAEARDRRHRRDRRPPGGPLEEGKEHDEGDVRLPRLPSVVKFEKGDGQLGGTYSWEELCVY